MTTIPTPLVTREALLAFTQRLVERYAPEKVILFGSLARGEGRWDSDADILVVMPFEGRHLAKIREMRRLCPVRFPLDLLLRRPEEIEVRYRGGDWEALEILLTSNSPGLRDAVVFHAQQCVEKLLKARLIQLGQTVDKIHDLAALSRQLEAVDGQWSWDGEELAVDPGGVGGEDAERSFDLGAAVAAVQAQGHGKVSFQQQSVATFKAGGAPSHECVRRCRFTVAFPASVM